MREFVIGFVRVERKIKLCGMMMLAIAMVFCPRAVMGQVNDPYAAEYPEHEMARMIDSMRKKFANKPTSERVLKQLQTGNRNFINQHIENLRVNRETLERATIADQSQYAIASILACSDSRVPVELIFDQGILSVFVNRVAGNVAGVTQLGSLEYGLAHLYTPVFLVLGHERCGAVQAAIDVLDNKNIPLEENIPALVENIKPAVLRANQMHPAATGEDLLHIAVEENVYQQIAQSFYISPITRELSRKNLVRVIGAVYNLNDGTVRWLPEEKIAEIRDQIDRDPFSVKVEYQFPNLRVPMKESPLTSQLVKAAPSGEELAEQQDQNAYPLSHASKQTVPIHRSVGFWIAFSIITLLVASLIALIIIVYVKWIRNMKPSA
ncbi:carbonic anhydrase [Poriferisphaera sp. WC338]|uniref:carbonic anhydrase n=1 Tax=Poriferisphaera sp. WC338 TaxID=3425129 RepID=UPI003D817480